MCDAPGGSGCAVASLEHTAPLACELLHSVHISVTTYRLRSRPAAPEEQLWLNRVYRMPFPVKLPKEGVYSLPEALVQLLSKPRASRGGWTPSVYPLKYVLGFQVNVIFFSLREKVWF